MSPLVQVVYCVIQILAFIHDVLFAGNTFVLTANCVFVTAQIIIKRHPIFICAISTLICQFPHAILNALICYHINTNMQRVIGNCFSNCKQAIYSYFVVSQLNIFCRCNDNSKLFHFLFSYL